MIRFNIYNKAKNYLNKNIKFNSKSELKNEKQLHNDITNIDLDKNELDNNDLFYIKKIEVESNSLFNTMGDKSNINITNLCATAIDIESNNIKNTLDNDIKFKEKVLINKNLDFNNIEIGCPKDKTSICKDISICDKKDVTDSNIFNNKVIKKTEIIDEIKDKKSKIYLNSNRKLAIIDSMPTQEQTGNISKFFSMFADNTRLKIIICLSIQSMTVGDISEVMNTNQTTISHQLQLLKLQKIVSQERVGKNIIYSLKISYFNEIMNNVLDNCI